MALPNLRPELFPGALSDASPPPPPPIGVWVAKSQLRALATHTPIFGGGGGGGGRRSRRLGIILATN